MSIDIDTVIVKCNWVETWW